MTKMDAFWAAIPHGIDKKDARKMSMGVPWVRPGTPGRHMTPRFGTNGSNLGGTLAIAFEDGVPEELYDHVQSRINAEFEFPGILDEEQVDTVMQFIASELMDLVSKKYLFRDPLAPTRWVLRLP